MCFGTHGLTRQNFSKWRYSRCSSPTVNGVYASNSLHTKLPPAQSSSQAAGLQLRSMPPECTKGVPLAQLLSFVCANAVAKAELSSAAQRDLL